MRDTELMYFVPLESGVAKVSDCLDPPDCNALLPVGKPVYVSPDTIVPAPPHAQLPVNPVPVVVVPLAIDA